MAIETGAIRDQNAVVEWDQVVRNRRELNRDLDLQTAQALGSTALPGAGQRIGPGRMQHFIDIVKVW